LNSSSLLIIAFSESSENAIINSEEELKELKQFAADDYSMHSGGAYGADTLFDQIARQFGITNINHYMYGQDTVNSKTLRDAGVKPQILTDE